MPAPLLQLRAVEKSFTGTRALKPLTLHLAAGEVLGLVGENGAGKSTLIKILSGVHAPDAGTIRWLGREVEFASPHDALGAGIATIHQELAYCGHLTVAENLLLGERWPRHRWGGVNWSQLHQQAAKILARCELQIPTRTVFSDLSAAQKQEVAIARALDRNAKLLVLDEPTASLTEPEVKRLFVHLNRLRSEGVALLYVSHRLDEILQLTDRVAVLRDGELVATYPTAGATVNRIVKDMVGRSLADPSGATVPVAPVSPSVPLGSPTIPERPTETVADASRRHAPLPRQAPLILDRLTREGMFRDISFTLHAGEIVGLAGLVGAGRSELARAIYGLYPCDNGTMHLHGKPWKPGGPEQALASGLVYLPEERKRQGLVLEHSVADSISIGFSDLLTRFGLVPQAAEQSRVREAMQRYDVRAASPAQPIGTLSGGNQQKAILARWLEREPRVILLDEPTRGVDVGAKAEIHQLIDRLAGSGCAVLLISSDLPEILSMSDRALVMHQGRIAAELSGAALTQENVILAASGLETHTSIE